MTRRLVIAGNGAAGFSALQAIRELDRESAITVVSAESGPAYLRVLLAPWLGGRLEDAALAWARREDYARLGASLVEDSRAVALDADSRRLTLKDSSGRHEVLPYDALLVATGASPVVPAAVRRDADGVWVLRTVADAARLREALARTTDLRRAAGAATGDTAEGTQVAVVGAGPLGLKAAIALLERGLRPLVIEMFPHLLPGKADWEAAAMVRWHLEQKGMRFRLGTMVTGMREAGGRLVGLEVSTGRPEVAETSPSFPGGGFLECRHVVFCTGVRPECGWLPDRLEIQMQALAVDAAMRTTADGVFAAGDAACAFDVAAGRPRANAIWPQAVAMGRIAGLNMALGARCAERPFLFPGGLARNSLDVMGLPFCSMGIVDPRAAGGLEARIERGAGWHRMVAFKEGRMVGAVLVGRVEDAGRIQAVLRKEAYGARHSPPAAPGGAL
jgi:nitrite reductase (NADH) large subunit